MDGNTSAAKLSHWAFSQLCYLTRAPAKYLRILLAELAQNCLSYGIERSNQRCKLLLRGNSDTWPQKTPSQDSERGSPLSGTIILEMWGTSTRLR